MIAIYKYIYLAAIVIAICLFVTAIILFSSFHICSIIKELKHSNHEENIKALLKNSVLLNPQIQDDLPNIDGYNDLLASYFKIIKQQEKQLEEAQKRVKQALEQKKMNQIPTDDMDLNVPKDWNGTLKYSVEMVGTDTIVECYQKQMIKENRENNKGGTVGCREKLED